MKKIAILGLVLVVAFLLVGCQFNSSAITVSFEKTETGSFGIKACALSMEHLNQEPQVQVTMVVDFMGLSVDREWKDGHKEFGGPCFSEPDWLSIQKSGLYFVIVKARTNQDPNWESPEISRYLVWVG